MEQSTRKPLHPLLVVAAVAVIVFCAVGIAAITGVLPTSRGNVQPALDPVTEPAARPEPPAAAEPVRPQPPRTKSAAAPQSQRAAANPAPAPAPDARAVPERYEPAPQAAAEPPRAAPAPVCLDCGVIESIREVKQQGEGSGVGAVAGGVAGAVLGNQVGGGRGRDLATVVGAVGGAVAGHQIEKRVRTNSSYQITVRMDDGSVRTFTESAPPAWRMGQRVRIQGDRLTSEG